MEQLLSQLPYAGWIIAIVVLILGAGAGFYLFDAYRERKKQSAVTAANDLVKILNETVQKLKDEVKENKDALDELTEKVDKLKTDNEILTKVLQGRDDTTQEFYRQGFAAMKINLETNNFVKEIAEGIKSQNEHMNRLIDLIGQQIEAGKDAAHTIVDAAKIPTIGV